MPDQIDAEPQHRIAVVGGGIAGLTAAYLLAENPANDVVLLEGSPRVGGKLRLEEVAGVTVDVGAEAMLNRRPEGVDLARELDLEVVHPTAAGSRLWTRDDLRPLPRTVMGVPLDPDGLAASGILSDEALGRVRAEATEPPTQPPTELDGDVSVGELVAARLGDEVVDRLVEPLLGGVYAGHARLLSARAATPQLVSLLERGSLVGGARELPASDEPVFAGIPGGVGRLPQALVDSGRFAVRTDATVRNVRRTPSGFELVVGPTRSEQIVHADAVVLATPAAPTARLLDELAPAAAAELRAVDYASVAVVTLAFHARDAADWLPDASGFLVPPVDGRRIKASTFSFAKWDWVREAGLGADEHDDVLLLRTSLGRHREEQALQVTDDELVEASLADLAVATGLRAAPVDSHVQRWGGGLPQYAVGHLDRVERIRTGVARVPGLALCGAAYDGVGIPAVIASARRAAVAVAAATV